MLRRDREELIEERFVPSRGELGGKLLASSDQGLIREVRVLFCQSCRRHLKLEEVFLCRCNSKVCQSCVKEYEGQKLCLSCVQSELPLTKIDLMILEAIQAGMRSKTKIADLARISNAETTSALRRLVELGFLKSQGFSIFSKPLLTNKALAALNIYSGIYQDADLWLFRTSLSSNVENNED